MPLPLSRPLSAPSLDGGAAERANLKNRQKDVFARMEKQYATWEPTMLPEDPSAGSSGFSSSELADHIGARPQRPER